MPRPDSLLLRLSALSLLALAGCAHMPDLGKAPDMDNINAFEDSESFKAEKAAWPDENWWQVYNDIQLNQLITDAQAGSPTLQTADARVHRAEAVAHQALATIMPSVNLNAEVDKTKQSYYEGVPPEFVPHGYQNYGSATLDFSYDLDFWGRNRDAVKAAISEVKAAYVESAQTKLMLSTSIVSAYADLAHNYADRDAAQKALEVRNQSVQQFNDRFKNGLENIGSLKQAQANQSSAKAEVLALDEQIALTKNRLAELVGKGPDYGLKINRPTTNLTQHYTLPENIPANLLGRRPDIVAARMHVESRVKAIDAARKDFYPDINLNATIGQQAIGLNFFTKSGAAVGNIGPAISLPIFDGGQRDGQYRAVRAEYEDAVATYNDTLTKALQDVADVATSQRALAGRLSAIQQAVQDSEAAWQVANNRYKGGIAPYLTVLSAEDTLITNRRALADLQSRIFSLDVEMVHALGGGYQSEQNNKKAL
jgi:NodT family efflux transporter outer membrane factor (OMF) lipoprotein